MDKRQIQRDTITLSELQTSTYRKLFVHVFACRAEYRLKWQRYNLGLFRSELKTRPHHADSKEKKVPLASLQEAAPFGESAN